MKTLNNIIKKSLVFLFIILVSLNVSGYDTSDEDDWKIVTSSAASCPPPSPNTLLIVIAGILILTPLLSIAIFQKELKHYKKINYIIMIVGIILFILAFIFTIPQICY